MLFGIPITISKGGIIPDKIVTLYPNKCNIPSDQTTPISTISTGTKTALKERKNINSTIIQETPGIGRFFEYFEELFCDMVNIVPLLQTLSLMMMLPLIMTLS